MSMPSNIVHPVSLAVLCLVVVLSGCGGSPRTDTTTAPPTDTDTPRQTIETSTATTEAPPTAADSPPSPTASPTTESVARGGLLIVEVVATGTQVNESGPVQYDRAIFDRSPTLNDAVTEAVSTDTTQRRDLSGQEVRRTESVADEYNRSISELVVSKNGTVVRVSLAYEV